MSGQGFAAFCSPRLSVGTHTRAADANAFPSTHPSRTRCASPEWGVAVPDRDLPERAALQRPPRYLTGPSRLSRGRGEGEREGGLAGGACVCSLALWEFEVRTPAASRRGLNGGPLPTGCSFSGRHLHRQPSTTWQPLARTALAGGLAQCQVRPAPLLWAGDGRGGFSPAGRCPPK